MGRVRLACMKNARIVVPSKYPIVQAESVGLASPVTLRVTSNKPRLPPVEVAQWSLNGQIIQS